MNTIEFYLNYPLIPVDGGIYLVKDCEHRFVASNSFFSKFSGIKPEKLQGLCDFDMPWDEHSQMYIDHEKAILSGENYKVLEPLPGVENAFLHTSKSVLFDQKGRPAGTAAMALLVNGVLDFKNICGVSKNLKVTSYRDVELTANESCLLFYHLKGYNRNSIAEMMRINLSTYDYYMRCLKKKFAVRSTNDLVDVCVEKNYHEIYPFQISI